MAERGRAVAREHTWAHRSEQLMRILNDVVDRRSAAPAAHVG
jgi:hypothetical protein